MEEVFVGKCIDRRLVFGRMKLSGLKENLILKSWRR